MRVINYGGIGIKFGGKQFIVFLIVLGSFLIQGALGFQIASTGSSNGESGTVTIQINAAKDASVMGEASITGSDIEPSTSVSGLVNTFSQTHRVTDKSGKTAEVTVNVVNAQNGLQYKSKVLPKQGTLKTVEPWVSAEQWLTVTKADSITCTASASYKDTLSVEVGLDEQKGTGVGDYVSVSNYYGKAYASATKASSTQTATSGNANSINIYGTAMDSSGTYSVNTLFDDASGGRAKFKGLSEMSSAGSTTQVVQTEYLRGIFTSTSTYTPTTGTSQTTTRTSNYGTEYDLNIKAAKGSSPTGIVGYYVDTSMATPTLGAIQGAVGAAQSGDTINVAAGKYAEDVTVNKALTLKGSGNTTANSFYLDAILGKGSGGITAPIVYVTPPARIQDGVNLASSKGTVNVAAGTYTENVKIDKSLVVNGEGAGITIVDGNKKGSVFATGYSNPLAKVTLSGMTIQGGSGKSITTKYGSIGVCGGGVLNYGTLNVKDSTISGNTAGFLGGGIYNVGKLNVLDSTITTNKASWGGGFYNYGTATVTDSSIIGNSASNGGGGIYACCSSITTILGSQILSNTAKGVGGGIAAQGALTIQASKISGKGSVISGNTAKQGGGIGWLNKRPVIDYSTTTITGNSPNQVYP